MTYPDGGHVPEFMLHMAGDKAWWRWSDEPLDGSGSVQERGRSPFLR